MKIAYLSTFYPFRGGIAQFNANLYKVLQKEHEVIPFTFKRQYPKILFPGKTQYITENDSAPTIDSIPVLDTANPLTYAASTGRIAKEHPDVLIMKYWMTYFAPSLGTVAQKLKKQGCKVITVLDNVIPHEPHFFDKPLTKWFLKQNSGFVAMSEAVRNDLLSLYPEALYTLLPHPLYDHFGEKTNKQAACMQLGIDSAKKILLFFGLIRDYKGLDLLIDSLSLLDESYHLIIAGESYGDFGKYNRQIEASPAKQRITVLNRYIDDNEVPLLFSASDLLVIPYRSATQSGVIPIAYHFEVPVLATDVGGLKETIEKAGTGLICLPQTENIAQGIQCLFQLGKERFIANIRKEKQLLSWEIFAGKLLAFAEQL
ncbi:MAG: glycosyltransferase [Candidatus Symbiothrix sp.]|jgi:glycosyltransferase involved in cell wall biosynthesis|nr:glycosyltransferase [Candidatus Symbiothrix sp.]